MKNVSKTKKEVTSLPSKKKYGQLTRLSRLGLSIETSNKSISTISELSMNQVLALKKSDKEMRVHDFLDKLRILETNISEFLAYSKPKPIVTKKYGK